MFGNFGQLYREDVFFFNFCQSTSFVVLFGTLAIAPPPLTPPPSPPPSARGAEGDRERAEMARSDAGIEKPSAISL